MLRVVRPTDRLNEVESFYREGLDLAVLARFANHDGFDGVILGHPGAPYHLEFTHHPDHPAADAPSPEHLLVFYVPDKPVWQRHVEALGRLGHQPITAFNPYWNRQGLTFADPDGWRIVLQNAAWTI